MNHPFRRIGLLFLFGACLLVRVDRTETLPLGAHIARASLSEGSEDGKEENRELIFKVINFLLLAGGLTYLLRKPLSEFFTQRSASIRKSLDEGRKALEASQAQLSVVEEKLRRLGEEIETFKASARREMELEGERLREAAAEESKKILESARVQVETAIKAAKLELKTSAAQDALKLAEQIIRERLDDSARRRLVSRFLGQLKVDS